MKRFDLKTVCAMIAPPLLMLAIVFSASTGVVNAANEAIAPKLAIPIPTVKLSGGSGGEIPFLAQYITGVYEYAAGIASLLAGVMIVYSGFVYLTAGSSGRIGDAQKRIVDAVIGLLLTLGSYVILNTINPSLVSLKPLTIKKVATDTSFLSSKEGPGFASPEVMMNGFKKGVSLDAPPASSTAPDAPVKDVAIATAAPTGDGGAPQAGPTPAGGSEPQIAVIDLYDKDIPNKYETFVKGKNWLERMNSVCVKNMKKKGGDSKEEVLERAAAITRVWINECMSGGCLYVRSGNGIGDFTYRPQFLEYLADSFNKGLASCMQPMVAPSGITPETIATCRKCGELVKNQAKLKTEGKQAEIDLLVSACAGNEDRCKDDGPVHNALVSAYRECWAKPAYKEGVRGGDCVTFQIQLAECALGKRANTDRASDVLVTFNTGKEASVKPRLLDTKPWEEAMAKVDGPKPFDFYRGGGKTKGGGCHAFMYIGGLGLKTKTGRDIYWIEMGGGGPADLLGGTKSAGIGPNALAGKGTVGGITDIGVRLHLTPTIAALSGTGCFFGPKNDIMSVIRFPKVMYGF